MDDVERYDVIMLGTGFTECILANLLCMEGKKVLVLDKERFSGGANGSIADLESLQQKFSMSLPRKDGEWNVDLIPKVFFGKNGIVELLNFMGVKIDTEPIHSATLWQNNALCSVPSSNQQVEVLKIPEADKVVYKELIYLSKQRIFSVQNNDSDEKAENYLDKRKVTSKTKEILLHGMLEDQSGKTLSEFLSTLDNFCQSQKFKATSFHYPVYGNGEVINKLLKKLLSRGGRLMLNRPVDCVRNIGGMVLVEARGLKAMTKFVVGDPSYFDSVESPRQEIVRALCVTDEKLITPSGGCRSCFITVPGREVEKRHDTHVLVLGSDHCVSPEGLFVVYASTVSESEDAESEIRKSLNFLTNVRTLSVYVTSHDPIHYEAGQKILKTSSCNYSMSWNDVIDDVFRLYGFVVGKVLAL